MKDKVRRIYVEKKKGFDIEANSLCKDFKENLGIKELEYVRIINRYDISGISDEEYQRAKITIFSEPVVDDTYDEEINIDSNEKAFAIEYLPGQYDQRADSAAQCIQILTCGERPLVKAAKLIVLGGNITPQDFNKIKEYCINTVESQEASMEKPSSLSAKVNVPDEIKSLEGFINMNKSELEDVIREYGLAMSIEDIKLCCSYFRDVEKRDPTFTEIRVLDTYWSDHCRHTTFLTSIKSVDFEEGIYTKRIKQVYDDYLRTRKVIYGDREKDICLMDIATLGMKELKRTGSLDNLDESDEVNACSIIVDVDVDGENQQWLVMFKNETHNHPTEIEPFGGAATCLGGGIRDPLSGRSYVYQAMRVTGSGDPRTPFEDTIPGKLPQRKITTVAAKGYSSYGNQIGLATGQVAEIYDEGYVAKRMEIGALVGAAPRDSVYREKPRPGDVVILLGGKTGRDGCGGATGSSKAHTEESLESCGAEVQKGNAPEERKIQRLFRNPTVTKMIKKCNDFGAGGVSVAIGELAPGLEIDLDAVPKKYEGLDGTELAISESQERMAVVVSQEDVQPFIAEAGKENLEATKVAVITETERMKMFWRGQKIVDISREFLDTNGAKQYTEVFVKQPLQQDNYFNIKSESDDIINKWIDKLQDINVCSQKGLVDQFDSTIGAGTVLLPLGGKHQLTPAECMAAKIPVLKGDTTTGTLMSFGYNPNISRWSPFHGAVYAVVEAVAKIVATGGDYKGIRLSLQEYFESLGDDPVKWGKPFSALLGAYYAQVMLDMPAIGGKDSMSGTFNELTVPPTLVAFAVNTVNVSKVISPEFKSINSTVVMVTPKRDSEDLPDFEDIKSKYSLVHALIERGEITAAHSVRVGGICEAISKMCFGNKIGFTFKDSEIDLFMPEYGSIVLEIPEGLSVDEVFNGTEYKVLGYTQKAPEITIANKSMDLDMLIDKWSEPLEQIFPTKAKENPDTIEKYEFEADKIITSSVKTAKPRIFIPVFPGTNCEYDTAKAFEKAGGIADIFIVKNLTPSQIEETLQEMVRRIEQSQIIMMLGGFSAGDEPDGSGKFIATAFRNPQVKEATMKLINRRDGLILGICNGFQALIKLGLIPYGEIRDIDATSPTLTFNTIGSHVSQMVNTKVTSNLSPWFNNVKLGDIHTVPVSHGEGRFVGTTELIKNLKKNGQIATQYVDVNGNPTYDIRYNPNGSMEAIEAITSPDGRILGKMAHTERVGTNVAQNIPGEKNQRIFEAGVNYYIK
jgi:phosphoribosylformylglycinamidine synthase